MRPPTMDDLEIVHALQQAYDLAFEGEEDMTLEDLRTYWTAPKHDLERDQRLVFDRQGKLIANLYTEQQQFAKFFIDVLIRPGYSDTRVGDYLFELGESRAREQMAQAEPDARVTLNAWAVSSDRDSLERYARMGMKEVRRYWHMEIEIDEAPVAPVWPQGIELRPFVPERDARAVFEAIDESFSDHWGHMPGNFDEWRHRKIEIASFDPSLWFIAWEGEQVAGGALCSDSAQSWVDTLGVRRPWRGKGLGLALLRQAFGEFYRRGRRKVVLGVDSQNLTGAVRLYQRAGMHIGRENISFEKELRAGVELSTQELSI